MVNTMLPIFIFIVSYSVHKTKIDLYLAKMADSIGSYEMKTILTDMPQALFFIDEMNEEILLQSDAMMSFFGNSVD